MTLSALLTGLCQMKQEELQQIDVACGVACDRARDQVASIGVQLKLVVTNATDITFIATNDLNSPHINATVDKLKRQTVAALQNVGREQAKNLQIILQNELATEINRLHGFATTVDQLIQYCKRSLLTAALVNQTNSLVKQLEPLWAEYRHGGTLGPNTDFGTGLLVAALGVPTLAYNLLLFKPEIELSELDITVAKQSYQAAVLAEIDQFWQLHLAHIRQNVMCHIIEMFNQLKKELDRGLDQHLGELMDLPESALAQPSIAPQIQIVAHTCEHCHSPLKSGAKFCSACGAAVDQVQPVPAMSNCPKCNELFKPGVRFCGNCGYQVAI